MAANNGQGIYNGATYAVNGATAGAVNIVATATTTGTQVQTLQDATGTLALLSGSQTWTGSQDFTGATTTVATVTPGSDSSTKAASTAFVQSAIASGFANPSGLIGMTAVNGVATTGTRSDARHAIDPAISPTWTGQHQWNVDFVTGVPPSSFLQAAITLHPLSLATASVQYNSPILRWTCAGWDTGTSSADTRNWYAYAVPVAGATATSYLHFGWSQAAFSFPVDFMSLFESGGMDLSNSASPADPGYGFLNVATGYKIAGSALAASNLSNGVTGTGAVVLANSPTLVTPNLGTVASGVWNGTKIGLVYGGTNADLSATGGTGQFLRQSSAGAAVTVGAIGSADLTSALTTPPPIGGTTPNTGSFTTMTVSTSGAVGTPALVVGTSATTGFYGGTSTALACSVGGVSQWNINASGMNFSVLALFRTSSASVASTRMPVGSAPTTPSVGDTWHDSTRNAFIDFSSNGLAQSRVGAFYQSIADVTSTSTSATSLLATGASKIGNATLPAGFWTPGKGIRILARGSGFTTGTGNSFALKLIFNGTNLSTSGAITPTTTPQTGDGSWTFEGVIKCRTVGASGTLFAHGVMFFGNTAAATGGSGRYTTAPTVTTINTTVSGTVDFTMQFGGSTGSPSITVNDLSLEVLF